MTGGPVARTTTSKRLAKLPLAKCRVTVRKEHRDVMLNAEKRPLVRAEHRSPHAKRGFKAKSGASVWIFTFKKTASRSFRYLSLSLQNGVLRNQGDTGERALPTLKAGPITVQIVLLTTRLFRPAGQSECPQFPACAHCTKCRGSEVLFKFEPQGRDGPHLVRVPPACWGRGSHGCLLKMRC